MIIWRIVSSIKYHRTIETPFYAIPAKFCEAINKYFTEFYEEDKEEEGFIRGDYSEDELSNFAPEELLANFNCPGECNTLFEKIYYDYDEPTHCVEIETAEVLV